MPPDQPGDRLRRLLKGRSSPPPLDASPISAWDIRTQQRLENMAAEIAEVKRWVMGLIAAVIGSALISLFRLQQLGRQMR